MFRSEWLTAMPTGEALVRRRGENLKLRVPLLLPVTRKEVRAIAEQYGLGKVLAAVQPEAAAAVGKAPASGNGVAVSTVAEAFGVAGRDRGAGVRNACQKRARGGLLRTGLAAAVEGMDPVAG